jgi:virulence factor Mce-like protein
MRRLALILAIGLALPAVLVFGLGAGVDPDPYQVRAIFDNVRLTQGEDVKVAGAKVGKVHSLDLTPDHKAAVVLDIQKNGFKPFRADARCTVRPQSLIGETYVECEPGTSGQPELKEIPEGEDGEGQHLLPLDRTSSPVDLDLVNNILRRPYRERLGILLGEFGTALAGRGKDLNEAVHRANPALRETDDALKILARQNRVLADLASDSDKVLAPLARERARVADFVVQANDTAEATAERRADIERTIARLPRFLPELRKTLRDLGDLSDEMTPVLADLGDAAPDLNRFVLELGPFSRAAIPSLRTLGDAVDVGGPALVRSKPTIDDLRRFAADADPVSLNLDRLTKSLDETGGIEELMNYIFFQMTAINGFDGVSHYLRAQLLVNLCSNYVTTPTPGCSANFAAPESSSNASAGSRDDSLAKLRAALARGLRKPPRRADPNVKGPSRAERLRSITRLRAQREAALERIRRKAKTPPPAPGVEGEPVLDYLLGSDG